MTTLTFLFVLLAAAIATLYGLSKMGGPTTWHEVSQGDYIDALLRDKRAMETEHYHPHRGYYKRYWVMD